MSCKSLEDLLAEIDEVIATYNPRNRMHMNALEKEASQFRRASQYMRDEINREIKRRSRS